MELFFKKRGAIAYPALPNSPPDSIIQNLIIVSLSKNDLKYTMTYIEQFFSIPISVKRS